MRLRTLMLSPIRALRPHVPCQVLKRRGWRCTRLTRSNLRDQRIPAVDDVVRGG
jgi:hypothetical protein